MKRQKDVSFSREKKTGKREKLSQEGQEGQSQAQ